MRTWQAWPLELRAPWFLDLRSWCLFLRGRERSESPPVSKPKIGFAAGGKRRKMGER